MPNPTLEIISFVSDHVFSFPIAPGKGEKILIEVSFNAKVGQFTVFAEIESHEGKMVELDLRKASFNDILIIMKIATDRMLSDTKAGESVVFEMSALTEGTNIEFV